MYKAYGYKSVEKLKQEYNQNVAWNIAREKLVKLPCYKNCQMRCEKCLYKIEECGSCEDASSLTESISNWWKEKNCCHVCRQELSRDWNFCDICKSDKRLEFCSGPFHGKQGALKCDCEISCCGKKYCSICTARMTLGFCEKCQKSFCVNHAHLHRDVKCADPVCGVILCKSAKSYCSENCREKNMKECSICGKKELPNNLERNGACYSCSMKYRKNFYYNTCNKCRKYKKTRYYRQRDKVSQPLTWLCETCRKEELKKCTVCGCCIILLEKEFLQNKIPCKKAYFISEGFYVCSRPRCVHLASEKGMVLKEKL